MPNIEIHGSSEEVSKMLRRQIFEELFKDKPYVDEMVVTIVPSEVRDVKTFEQPFFRLLSPDSKEAEEILRILHEKVPGIDIEYLEVRRFIPKQ